MARYLVNNEPIKDVCYEGVGAGAKNVFIILDSMNFTIGRLYVIT